MKRSPPPGAVVSCMIILFYTLCVKRQEQNMKDLWHFVVKRGYERREAMSFGDKTIIMLNLCDTLKVVPSDFMLTVTAAHA